VSVSHVTPDSTDPLTSHELDEILAMVRNAVMVERRAHGPSAVTGALIEGAHALGRAAGYVAGREARQEVLDRG
jgi:hypothetical protein